VTLAKYKSIFPHVAAAMQLSILNGKNPAGGDNVEYVIRSIKIH
jgi:hypothetical protein